MARRLVRRSDLLVVHDEESAHELVGVGVPGPVRVGADPVWALLAPPEASGARRAERVLVIPPRRSATGRGVGGGEETAGALPDAVAGLVGRGMRVALQPWEHPDDGAPRSRPSGPPGGDPSGAWLMERACGEVERLPAPASLAEAVSSMRDAGVVLTYRFHGLVAAGAAGVPTVAVAHEAKLAGLSRRLGQRAVAPEVGPEELCEAVLGAVGSSGPDPGVVKQEIERAEEGFQLLRVLLASGDTEESHELRALPLSEWS
ncbi:MAG: polysaccharide pyruvyl transferase family protein [Solirubrobacteraceae bacterium]